MKIHSVSLIVVGLLTIPQAWPQDLTPPQTYSFAAESNMMGPMTVTVNRNGPRELVDLASPSGSFHLRILYDFQEHRLYTVDVTSDQCTTQEYMSSYAPTLHDPVGSSDEMIQQARALATIRKEQVNGINARVVEAILPEQQGKYRLWLEDRLGFPVKQMVALGKEPESVVYEMRKISYAPSDPSLFALPKNCSKIAGTTDANGGHAEMNVDASADGQATFGDVAPEKKAAPAGDPKRLLGKWAFTGKDGAGVDWSGTITVGKLDEDTFSRGQFSNLCDFDLQSGDSGKGMSGACLYDDHKKTLTFESDFGSDKFSLTAVLAPNGKNLTGGRWEDRSGKGTWSATSKNGM